MAKVEIKDNETLSIALDNATDLLTEADLYVDDEEYDEALEQVEEAQAQLEDVHTYLVAKKAANG